jgi:MerR family copper efflux transcriptional regulator
MKIGELSRLSGVTTDTIRFYEHEGLLPAPQRKPSGYRDYSPSYLRRLSFIKRARELGFGLGDISQLLVLAEAEEAGAKDVRELTAAKIEDIQARIAQLQRIVDSLKDLLRRCEGDGVTRAQCPILNALAPQELQAP